MKRLISPLIVSLLVMLSQFSFAQNDLLNMLDEGDENSKEEVRAVFKGTRVVLGHSVKMKKKGELEFLISHRFGTLNSGAHNLWGLDASWIRLGLEYGLNDNLNIGIGRSSFDKTFDGFLKYKLLKQNTDNSMPISVVAFSSMAIKTIPKQEDDSTIVFKNRLVYTTQLLISRKFNSKLSLQVSPTFVHKNLFMSTEEENLMALGLGGRYKLTPSLSLNMEYFYRINEHSNSINHDAFSIGVDIETGGHVFQLHLTNSVMSIEKAFVSEVFDNFFDGDIHFGFNISRTFQLTNKNN